MVRFCVFFGFCEGGGALGGGGSGGVALGAGGSRGRGVGAFLAFRGSGRRAGGSPGSPRELRSVGAGAARGSEGTRRDAGQP